ncbi:solute carrier family 15 member 1-like [Chiloscyllium plagiosum]|uniref:solute carrier family 15 member 1-like n=1 Tax=Chiloscyllium plagiosum TaxID=36176 RepID=UPI001CB82D47|nr:solute carrier family 15 member 1-like [Chiloscyllium plagiosum]XP_043547258.1 solute carrier family 15 member 1-like [Chiloscyllium plagiosum]XP_043547259.1 solute carrier family 15 member 1-like [Chiloscyllium plagiosum]
MKDKKNRDEEATSSKPSCFGFPISIFFIVVNEFCERFSYYGMRAVLVLYFRYFLHWTEDFATAIYHAFVALCYLTPIIGAIIADSWLGKFKTIIYLSIVYTIGQLVISISGIADITDTEGNGLPNNLSVHIALAMIGLILIALGTGGIKPCVSAFGGDQFEEHQVKQRRRFFSIFYLSINAGSLISTIITPILRGQKCGHVAQACYPLAFGVPAALMAIALIVFIGGSPLYRKSTPEGNIMLKVCKCIWFALKNRFQHRSNQYPKREHFMDWAAEKYDEHLIAQVKMVLKVLFLYLPLPMFWALFDQQGSRWTFQATRMDGDFGAIDIQPDQMQTVNPILILILVPIVDGFVYPLIAKCNFNFTPLRKMTVGMFLAALAFIVAALVQLQIDKTLPIFPAADQSQIKIVNVGNLSVDVTLNGVSKNYSLKPSEATEYTIVMTADIESFEVSYGAVNETFQPEIQHGTRHTLLVTNFPSIKVLLLDDYEDKPEEGKNAIRFATAFSNIENITMNDKDFGYLDELSATNYSLFTKGQKLISFIIDGIEYKQNSKEFGFGSAYTIIINEIFAADNFTLNYIEEIEPNSFHMAWQIPQYVLITSGEVVFSVTGLAFAYSQAPANMKSVLQAGWLLTNAIGNIIVLIVAEASTIQEQWAEYILFAALLVAVCIVFAIMAYFYTYVDPAQVEMEIEEEIARKKAEALEKMSYSENGTIYVVQSNL